MVGTRKSFTHMWTIGTWESKVVKALRFFRASRASRMQRYICRKTVEAVEEGKVCSLLLPSRQMKNIVGWTVRHFRFKDTSGESVSSHEIRTDQFMNMQFGCPSLRSTRFQICSEKSQWSKRWSRVSFWWLQKQQEGETFSPQLARRTLTGRRSKWAVQNVNECFGTEPLNQVAAVQDWVGADGLIASQVRLSREFPNTVFRFRPRKTNKSWQIRWFLRKGFILLCVNCDARLWLWRVKINQESSLSILS